MPLDVSFCPLTSVESRAYSGRDGWRSSGGLGEAFAKKEEVVWQGIETMSLCTESAP